MAKGFRAEEEGELGIWKGLLLIQLPLAGKNTTAGLQGLRCLCNRHVTLSKISPHS